MDKVELLEIQKDNNFADVSVCVCVCVGGGGGIWNRFKPIISMTTVTNVRNPDFDKQMSEF